MNLSETINQDQKNVYSLNESIDGILLVNKPKGVTSNQLVQHIKKKYHFKKVGHCGTLDPIARGLLILCLGKGTKISSYLTALDKEYYAVIQIGEERDTDDETGFTTKRSDKQTTEKEVLSVLKELSGEIDQIPPIYSAIKVDGKRAYAYARKGKTVTLASRKVFIYHSHLIDFSHNEIHLRVKCSKGTYIRSLARDIGRKLGTFAYLKELKREKIGFYRWNDEKCIQDYKNTPANELFDKIINLSETLYFMPSVKVEEPIIKRIFYGQKLDGLITLHTMETQKGNVRFYKLIDQKSRVLAIVDNYLQYMNVFHYENL